MIQLFNRDCLEAMREMPDKCFDLAIVDPPYGIGAGQEKPHNGWMDYGIKTWDVKPPEQDYFDELFRVSKNQIVWGANHFIDRMPYRSSCWLLWDKGQRDFSLADGELAWTSFKTSLRIFDYPRARALQEGKIHPTQKPAKLYEWLLTNYAKTGDTILDTHLGSGSIAIACHNLGFDLTAFEIDKEYFEAASKRLARHQAEPPLFELRIEPVTKQEELF